MSYNTVVPEAINTFVIHSLEPTPLLWVVVVVVTFGPAVVYYALDYLSKRLHTLKQRKLLSLLTSKDNRNLVMFEVTSDGKKTVHCGILNTDYLIHLDGSSHVIVNVQLDAGEDPDYRLVKIQSISVV